LIWGSFIPDFDTKRDENCAAVRALILKIALDFLIFQERISKKNCKPAT